MSDLRLISEMKEILQSEYDHNVSISELADWMNGISTEAFAAYYLHHTDKHDIATRKIKSKRYYDYIHIAENKTSLTLIGILEDDFDYHVQHITTGSVPLLSDIFFKKELLDACGIGKDTQITASSYGTGVLFKIKDRRANGEMMYWDINLRDLHFLESKNTTYFYGAKDVLNLLPKWDGQFIPSDMSEEKIEHLLDSEINVNKRLLYNVLIGGNHLAGILIDAGLGKFMHEDDVSEMYGTDVGDVLVAWKAIKELSVDVGDCNTIVDGFGRCIVCKYRAIDPLLDTMIKKEELYE